MNTWSTVPQFDDAPAVHHGDAIGDDLDQREVVGDEEVGEIALLLQVAHEVEHLRPHRHVERGDRLVGHDEVGLEGERAGDGDALELATRELGGVALDHVAAHADPLEELVHLARALLAAPS